MTPTEGEQVGGYGRVAVCFVAEGRVKRSHQAASITFAREGAGESLLVAALVQHGRPHGGGEMISYKYTCNVRYDLHGGTEYFFRARLATCERPSTPP